MSQISCRIARRLLAAYHDGELTMDVQVSVQAHLRTCPSCLAERRKLAELGALLRSGTRVMEDAGRLERHVIARLQVERQLSWRLQVNRLFEDLHLVWAAMGATAATIAVLCAVVGMMRMTLKEQPTSMAALIGTLSTPGSNRNPVLVDARMLLPRSNPDALLGSGVMERDEAVYALAAVVTREGRVRNLALLTSDGREVHVEEAALMELLDAASQTRFEPARAGGAPVAVSMVWLLAHTTVVGKSGDAWPILQAPAPAVPRTSFPVSENPPARFESTAA